MIDKNRYFGNYILVDKIGSGAYAVVYEAIHESDPRRSEVAIKILREQANEDFYTLRKIERFKREAEFLQHNNDIKGLVQVYEAGQFEGWFYYVMRLIKGKSLTDWIYKERKFTWEEIVYITRALANTLDVLHGKGVIHRDLKPSNIMLDGNDPVILDLGLALYQASPRLTQTNEILGTPPYTAPETFQQAGAFPQTDVYALGCIVFELVTGRTLFYSESFKHSHHAHVEQGADLPNHWPEGVPARLHQVLRWAVERDYRYRYATPGEFAFALAELGKGRIILPHHNRRPPRPSYAPVWLSYTSLNHIKSMLWSGNRLLAGTSGGILQFCPDDPALKIWKHTSSEGLPSLDVLDLCIEEPIGRVWAATAAGLAYSDTLKHWHAVDLRATGLSGPVSVKQICPRQGGGVWGITVKGVLEVSADEVKLYAVQSGSYEIRCLANGSDGQPWIGIGNHLLRFNGTEWLAPNGLNLSCTVIHCLRSCTHSAILWVGTNQGIFELAPSGIRHYTTANGLPSNDINGLACNSKGQVWAATPQGIASIYAGKISSLPLPPHPYGSAQALAVASSGVLWQGNRMGLGYWDEGAFYPLKYEFGLLDDQVYAVYPDTSGGYWFGCQGGISFHSPSATPKWRSYTRVDKIQGPVIAIAECPQGVLWFGTHNFGLYCLERGQGNGYIWKNLTAGYAAGLYSNRIQALLATRGGDLWIATAHGVTMWPQGRPAGRHYLSGLSVLCLGEDPDGGIWAGTLHDGLYFWDGGEWVGCGLSDAQILDLSIGHTETGYILWLATDQGVFQRLQDGTFQRAPIPAVTGRLVQAVWADHELTWFGLPDGALCCDRQGNTTRFTTFDGLVGNNVRKIVRFQPGGPLWFVTDHGASILD